MSIFKDYKKGDRIVVIKSLYGMYDGKKGTVNRVLESESFVEVILDINKGKIDELTLLPLSGVELDHVIVSTQAKQEGEGVKKSLDEIESLDDRLDNLEITLNKYNLSIKDGCGFMYIYDFLDELTNKWNEIEENDKDDICYYLVGDKNRKKFK